jgi:LCP family protein required for cell wall assembly
MTAEATRRRWPRVMAAVLSSFVLVATAAAGIGGYYANDLTGNIRTSNDGNFITAGNEGPVPGEPINILLMGSDTRQGKNSKGYGNKSVIEGARSDTTILLHISGDRSRAFAVSIPRDSLVTLPECKTPSGGTGGGFEARFNEAFDIGGPGCSVKAVQQLTGISIDHYIVVDFTGFKEVINALDGVEVCLKKAVYDAESKLDLSAGKHVVKGEEALAFVRARKALGDGSDISRIDRQQEFLSAAIRKATSLGVLTNPAQLYAVLTAGTKSLTADPALGDFDALKELALNASAVEPANITFATVPFTYNDDGGTISWIPSEAQELWTAIKDDQPWPPPPTNGADGQPLVVGPDEISVNVENASGVRGVGTRTSQLLTTEGYTIASTTDATVDGPTTILYNPKQPTQVEAARTLGYATGVTPTASKKVKSNSIVFQVGSDFDYTLELVVPTKPTAAAEAAKPRTAAEVNCSS